MDKGLFFLILSLTLFWLVLDDFFGSRYVSNVAKNLTSSWNMPGASFIEQKKEQYNEAAKQEKNSFLGKQQSEFLNRYGPA